MATFVALTPYYVGANLVWVNLDLVRYMEWQQPSEEGQVGRTVLYFSDQPGEYVSVLETPSQIVEHARRHEQGGAE